MFFFFFPSYIIYNEIIIVILPKSWIKNKHLRILKIFIISITLSLSNTSFFSLYLSLGTSKVKLNKMCVCVIKSVRGRKQTLFQKCHLFFLLNETFLEEKWLVDETFFCMYSVKLNKTKQKRCSINNSNAAMTNLHFHLRLPFTILVSFFFLSFFSVLQRKK